MAKKSNNDSSPEILATHTYKMLCALLPLFSKLNPNEARAVFKEIENAIQRHRKAPIEAFDPGMIGAWLDIQNRLLIGMRPPVPSGRKASAKKPKNRDWVRGVIDGGKK